MKHAIKQLFKRVEMWGNLCRGSRKFNLSPEKFQTGILAMGPQSCEDIKRSILFHSLFVQLFFQTLHIPGSMPRGERVSSGGWLYGSLPLNGCLEGRLVHTPIVVDILLARKVSWI